MFSKSVLELLGLKINVYGLDEFKMLPEHTPLSAMFFSHGSGQNQEMLEKHCQKMCQLNETRGFDERYLIMISIDHPNAGVRKVYDEEEFPTPGSFKHQDLAFKMYLHAKLTAQTISCIIECFDFYAFGLESNLFVEEWGIIGHSMGGMTAGFLPTYAPKVSTVILISACFRGDLWAPFFVKSFRLDPEFYVHKGIKEVMATGIKDKVPNLQNANLLMLYGDRDSRVPKSLIHETVGEIRETHKGKEGCDWKYSILPDTKHELNDAFISETMEWTKKWMLTNLTTPGTKMTARL